MKIGRTKVSNLANKKRKSLMDLSVKSRIQIHSEMKQYYERRIESGKNKMSTINIIRNKLVSRMFDVIARNERYVDLMKYAAFNYLKFNAILLGFVIDYYTYIRIYFFVRIALMI